MIRFISHIITTLLKFLSGYYLMRHVVWWLRKRNAILLGKKLYIKDFIDWDNKYIRFIRTSTKFTFFILSGIVLFYVFLSNLAPFGITQVFSLEEKDPQLSTLSPRDRVEKEVNGQNITYKQTGDLIYFTTNMPFHFDTATVQFTYQNPYPDQNIQIGFKDQPTWHYSSELVDNPLLNTLHWNQVGDSLHLYQKNPHYNSLAAFLHNPPQNALIGTYHINPDMIPQLWTTLSDYQPQKNITTIDVPLRGTHTFYAYLYNEKFMLSLTKRDLNWYEGEDPVSVKIFKDGDQVFEQLIPDDGEAQATHKAGSPQEISIQNPGPDLPEPGIYKIVIDANDDTIITQIKTNLHKIVAASPVYLAGNSDLYHQIVASTSATTLFTNALAVTAQTFHVQGEQTISIGNQEIKLTDPQAEEAIVPQSDMTQITIPKNDVILRAVSGYFAFAQEQFFTPSPYRLFPIHYPDDINLVDYILTDYAPPIQNGKWKIATYTFNVKNAVVDNGKLSWIINAPGLKEHNRTIYIKDIQVELEKKPLLGNTQ